MFKQTVLVIFAGLIAASGIALAQTPVDINKADQAALDGLRGIGPKLSQTILDERKRGGQFKDWADLEHRVKGIKLKSAMRLSDAGLTVEGQSRPPSTAVSDKPSAARKGEAGGTTTGRDTAAKK